MAAPRAAAAAARAASAAGAAGARAAVGGVMRSGGGACATARSAVVCARAVRRCWSLFSTTAATPATPATTTDLSQPARIVRTLGTPSSSSSSSSSPPRASSRVVDAVLGVLFGYTLYEGISWLVAWPEPLGAIVAAAELDPLVQAQIGVPVRASSFWTGNVTDAMASVVIPVSGAHGKGTLYARALYDARTHSWRFVYLHAAVGEFGRQHSLAIPPAYSMQALATADAASLANVDASAFGCPVDPASPSTGTTAAPLSPLVLPANFEPALLTKDQYIAYQEFLNKHGLREWSPTPAEAVDTVFISKQPVVQTASASASSTSDSPASTEPTQTSAPAS